MAMIGERCMRDEDNFDHVDKLLQRDGLIKVQRRRIILLIFVGSLRSSPVLPSFLTVVAASPLVPFVGAPEFSAFPPPFYKAFK